MDARRARARAGPRPRPLRRDRRAGRAPDAVPYLALAWRHGRHRRRTCLTRLNALVLPARYPPAIAEPIVAGGFWSRGGAEALRSLVGERFLPRLAAYPGPTLIINGSLRPARSGSSRATFARGRPRRAPGPPRRGDAPREPRPAGGLHRGRPPVRAVARPRRLTPRPGSAVPVRGPAAILTGPPNPPSRGSMRVRKAVFPAAGWGTRFLPGHQGAAEGDAAARRQADHPVRGRGGRRRRDRAGHHRHLQPEAGDRGPLRPLLRARAPARGEGRHRDAPPGPARSATWPRSPTSARRSSSASATPC